jgi:hypothetical protein
VLGHFGGLSIDEGSREHSQGLASVNYEWEASGTCGDHFSDLGWKMDCSSGYGDAWRVAISIYGAVVI